MVKFFYKLKNDLFLMIVSIICALVFLFDVFIVIFNLIQFIVAMNNSIKIFGGFLGLNIFTIIINVVAFILIVVYYIFSRRQVVSKNDEKK